MHVVYFIKLNDLEKEKATSFNDVVFLVLFFVSPTFMVSSLASIHHEKALAMEL